MKSVQMTLFGKKVLKDRNFKRQGCPGKTSQQEMQAYFGRK